MHIARVASLFFWRRHISVQVTHILKIRVWMISISLATYSTTRTNPKIYCVLQGTGHKTTTNILTQTSRETEWVIPPKSKLHNRLLVELSGSHWHLGGPDKCNCIFTIGQGATITGISKETERSCQWNPKDRLLLPNPRRCWWQLFNLCVPGKQNQSLLTRASAKAKRSTMDDISVELWVWIDTLLPCRELEVMSGTGVGRRQDPWKPSRISKKSQNSGFLSGRFWLFYFIFRNFWPSIWAISIRNGGPVFHLRSLPHLP